MAVSSNSLRKFADQFRLFRNFFQRTKLYSTVQNPPDANYTSARTTTSHKVLKDVNEIPLSESLPGFSDVYYSSKCDVKPFDSKITVLPSALTVASEPHYGQYCTLGVAINSGSRYEIAYPSGTSHFIEKLAFSKTLLFPSKQEMFKLLEKRSALIDCQSTKDTFIFAASCHVDGINDVLSVIADAVYRPVISDEILDDARLIINFENDDIDSKPDCEPLLSDWIHMAAYNGNTLGFAKYCPPENVNIITREHIYSFMHQYHTPERIVVAGIGVDHDVLTSLSEKLFNPSETIWEKDQSLLLKKEPAVDHSVAQYTGGEKLVEKDLSAMALGPSPFPNLAHVVIGFESCGFKSDDFVAFCVLQMLMGGGGSFSAGGPGKGMYTRLYLDVLNKHHWLYNATAFNSSYADTGLFYIQASCDPSLLSGASIVIAEQFLLLSKGVLSDELNRAKTQLKSQLMMNLEVRPVMFEDLARQVLGHGYRRKPSEYMEKIDSITNTDIIRIAERMLATVPSIVGYGDLKELPKYSQFDRAFAKRSVNELKSRSMFGF